MILVFFIYGLAFLGMGVAILLASRGSIRPELRKSFLWLAVFGLLHGINEWVDMALLIQAYLGHQKNTALFVVRPFLLGASFIFLLLFALKTIELKRPSALVQRWAPLALPFLGAMGLLLTGMGGGFEGWLISADIWARYSIGLPASALAALGLVQIAPQFRGEGISGKAKKLEIAAIFFVLYAILAGLIVPSAPYFPASLLNYPFFQEATGIPVQVFRAFSALVISFLIATSLQFGIRIKAYVSFTFFIVLLLTISASTYFFIRIITDTSQSLHKAHEEDLLVADLRLAWHQISVKFRDYLATGDNREKEEIVRLTSTIDEKLKVLEALPHREKEEVELIKGFKGVFLEIKGIEKRPIFPSSAREKTGLAKLKGDLEGVLKRGSEILARFAIIHKEEILEKARSLSMAQERAFRILLFGLAVAMVGTFTMAFLFSRFFAHPVAELKRGTQIIGRGNLDHRLKFQAGDEIQELAMEFNRMVERLKESYAGLEQKVAERTRELSLTNEELARALRIKSEFLATMSHELRTPLNSIIGFSEVLADQSFGPLNERQLKYVNSILKGGKRLLSLITDILEFSRLEAGKRPLELEEFDLGHALKDVIEIVRPSALQKDILIEVHLNEGTSHISADYMGFKQIIYQLLSNAIKFTPPDGSVTVAAHLVQGSQFTVDRKEEELREPSTVNRERDQDFVEISVSDTGIGIKPEERERIFRGFEQVDGSLSRPYEGAGLGLALVKKLVEMHGGRIWVESEGVGKGAKFSFVLPLKEREGNSH